MTPRPDCAWPPPGAKRVLRSGVDWHVAIAGEGPTLLALHGTASSGHTFGQLLPHLAPHFRVVIPDLPGHGETRVPRGMPLSLPVMAGALADLLTELGEQPTVVVGHSAGAAVGARLLTRRSYRVELFVGLAAALVPLRGTARFALPRLASMLAFGGAYRWAPRVAHVARVERTIRAMGSELPPEEVERYAALISDPARARSLLRMLASWDLEPLYQALPELAVPTVLFGGTRDRAVPIEHQRALAQRIPSARVVTIMGAGHLLHEEQPAAIAQGILTTSVSNHVDTLVRPSKMTPGS